MSVVKKYWSEVLEYNADTVEWCPDHNYRDILACGTYQLDESTESSRMLRKGCLHLYKLRGGEDRIEKIQSFDTPGILDMKWSIAKPTRLALSNAAGEVVICQLIEEDTDVPKTEQKSVFKLQENANQLLALSLDWSPSCSKIAASDSRGHISILSLDGTDVKRLYRFKAHDFEAWTCCFNLFNESIIYTGGDDSKLFGFDIRQGTEYPLFRIDNHYAGVTSLTCNRNNEFGLLSGSYDENIHSWDTRQLRSPVSTTNVKGGVWRMKWEPKESNLLSAACMYNGFIVMENKNDKLEIIHEYKQHESIAYGVDWCRIYEFKKNFYENLEIDFEATDVKLLAACSFYDKMISLPMLFRK